jgi:hypothetical protein
LAHQPLDATRNHFARLAGRLAVEAVHTANTVIRLIAQLEGFLGRKSDGEPGAKTLWLGLRDIAVFVQGLRYARELREMG